LDRASRRSKVVLNRLPFFTGLDWESANDEEESTLPLSALKYRIEALPGVFCCRTCEWGCSASRSWGGPWFIARWRIGRRTARIIRPVRSWSFGLLRRVQSTSNSTEDPERTSIGLCSRPGLLRRRVWAGRRTRICVNWDP